MAQMTEGTVPFQVPGKDITAFTYYKIFGDLFSGTAPLIILHGGPGVGHEYLLSFADLWHLYKIPVVFYDQIGCAASTHLQDLVGDKEFWQEPLFTAELENLIDHLQLRDGSGFHILGQSWGGMFGGAFAASRPKGLRRLVLASGLASNNLAEQSIQIRRRELGPDLLKVLEDCERANDVDNPAYKEALNVFNKKFVCRDEVIPPLMMPAFKHLSEDNTVYGTMVGPSVHRPNGSLNGWSSIPRLAKITAPTLVYNGEFDTSHDVGQVPYFELIPHVRWITFPNGGHMCHLEQGLRERVLKVVGEFLSQGVSDSRGS